MSGRRRQEGVVLVLVLVFLLLLASAIATFLRRAVLDATIVENRDAVARAEALARGGVRLATALLLEDRLREHEAGLRGETRFDVWARAENLELPMSEDASLRLRIDDAGARLNLNALFGDGQLRDGAAEVLLVELLERVIDEAALASRREYVPHDLARNLIDYVDADPAGLRAAFEDDYYQRQDPPYRAANRPLLTVDELALVEGFDPELVEALRPYVSVFPYVDGEGINPNTAPPWVLGILYHGVAGDYRFASEDVAAEVVRLRESGRLLCDETADDPDCTSLAEAVPGEVFPPPTFVSDVFLVSAEARVAGIRRTVEAVLDRSNASAPLLLSWRVR
jgi:general secretion pathway protein K